jgi:L-lactate dehydrogenase complex protein LldG
VKVSPRELVLERVRANQPAPQPLPPLPVFERDRTALVERFAAALARMGGEFVPGDVALDGFVRARFPAAHVICSAVHEVAGTRSIGSVRAPAALDDVDVAIVRAPFGIAETGSVFLCERELGLNALGFLAQHLVVLLDPAAIVADLHDAYRHPGFRTARYAALLTGPSATADIEGVLVRGAQGIRSLTVVAAPAG